jgi:hypothetical protein
VHVDFPLLQRLALPLTIGSVRHPGIKIHDTRIIRFILARSSTSNRQGTVAAKAVFAELSSMYRHCGSEAEINLDTAIGVQPAEHGRISRFERSGHNDRKHSLMGLVAGP